MLEKKLVDIEEKEQGSGKTIIVTYKRTYGRGGKIINTEYVKRRYQEEIKLQNL